ncbi:erythromycin esterase family protein [Mucilaginibacter sp. BJC16-A38]|uniref:erythromycin esterase family protein n=1 Tax=Mucilaginibacter phenanthrenivorans TaxID=1234842 RepID=UPI00215718FB|nr:erythromycin esterase family protein [Mucilaginibacter phenanthrenivorans]MCR8559519.1 erythromycin esterase family protein [Mucilaginibacter phenanthrenivorans]
MKNILVTLIATTLLLFSANKKASAQPKAEQPNNLTINQSAAKAVSMESYEAFKKSIKPLIEKMGTKQIIGLGEGTHGTAEFYKLRYWISRILVEEKGFNHIAFENDYSDGWLLNSKLNTTANLDSLMKKHMLSIWQNTETRELLTWVKEYNSTHAKKITINGIDYVFIMPDIEVFKQLIANTPAANFADSLAVIAKAAAYQDQSWQETNKKDSKFDFQATDKSSFYGYKATDKLDKQVAASNLPAKTKADCHLALLNIMQAFSPFYDEFMLLPAASRDSIMAYNTSLIMKEPGAKMIIWAHDVHLAKKGIYNDEVGGTGGKLLKMFPNDYFALGTGTASGTFAATTEPRDTYTNPMNAYPLAIPVKGSWDELLNGMTGKAFYFDPAAFNPGGTTKQMRFIGYGPDSGEKSYDAVNMNEMYDAYLFIKDTHAATPLK